MEGGEQLEKAINELLPYKEVMQQYQKTRRNATKRPAGMVGNAHRPDPLPAR